MENTDGERLSMPRGRRTWFGLVSVLSTDEEYWVQGKTESPCSEASSQVGARGMSVYQGSAKCQTLSYMSPYCSSSGQGSSPSVLQRGKLRFLGFKRKRQSEE